MGVIYFIKNLKNHKLYVGSAVNFSRRRTLHKQQLKKGKHHSVVLQRAWDKYGSENFEFGIFEEVDNTRLIVVEQKYLDELNPSYNIAKIAGSQLGIKRKKANVKRLNTLNSKPIKQFKDGKFVKRWKSITEASTVLQLGYTSINSCCLGKTRKSHGFYFEFANNPKPYVGKPSTAKLTKEQRSKLLVERKSKSYKILNPQNKVLEIQNLKKFSKENGLTLRRMYAVVSGKEESHKGFKLSV